MLKILRLMCLQSICCNGFGKKYDDFRREILQTYGYEYAFAHHFNVYEPKVDCVCTAITFHPVHVWR